MKLFIDAKLKGFSLNANEACIYSAIAAVSNGKGWYASCESLANHMPFVISTKTVERSVKHLAELGLIERRKNALFATTNWPQSNGDNLSHANDKLSPADRQIVAPKPTNCPPESDKLYPIYNKENKEKREENNACDTIDTPNSAISSFNKPLSLFDALLTAYKSLNHDVKPSDDALANARRLWDELPDYKQQQLLEAVQNDSWNKSRIDWLISDFRFREPFNYLGKEQPSGYSYFFAWHNGVKGLYTRQDVDAFHMTNVKHFMDL